MEQVMIEKLIDTAIEQLIHLIRISKLERHFLRKTERFLQDAI